MDKKNQIQNQENTNRNWEHPFPEKVKCIICETCSPAITYSNKHAYYRCPNQDCDVGFFIGWSKYGYTGEDGLVVINHKTRGKNMDKGDEEIKKVENNVRKTEKDILKKIPTITKIMIADSEIKNTKEWTGLDVNIMRKKDGDEGYYIFLGLVDESHIPDLELLEVISEDIPPTRRLGWFTPFPIRPMYNSYESRLAIYAWYIDLFEKMIPV